MFLVERCGIEDIAFYDDALLEGAETKLVPFLLRLLERDVRVRFHTPNGLHLMHVNEPLLKLMRDAGFTTLRFGYESGAAKHRETTGGKADRFMLEEKIALVRETGFPETGVYVMGGLPESSPEEMEKEMRYVASQGVKVKPVFVSPVPGTRLFSDYALMFPELNADPRLHNDTFFVTRLPGWGEREVEEIRRCARELNKGAN